MVSDFFFFASTFAGSGWSVYIIDTGVMASHNDFVARRTEQLKDFTDDDDNV